MANVLEESDLDLEQYCGWCNDGIGWVTKETCDRCDGMGSYMTPFGERVLAFVTKRLKLGVVTGRPTEQK